MIGAAAAPASPRDRAGSVRLIGCCAVNGRFPPRAPGHVLDWRELHRQELLLDWDLARSGEPLFPIEPLEQRMSIPHVIEARSLGGHRVWLRFDDGAEGEIDLADELDGPIFQPLRDPAYFARFTVDDTLVWPNGADFAPEFLRERVRAVEGAARPAG